MKSQHHSFDIHLAKIYGIEEAILIHHFQHWIEYNQRLGRNFKEGRTWSYQTYREIAAHFPYWTEDQVRDIIESLCTGKNRKSKKDTSNFEPVLIKGNFNKSKIDKTIWFAFKNEKMFTKGEIPSRVGKSPNGEGRSPDQYHILEPNTKTNIVCSPPSADLENKQEEVYSVTKKTPGGQDVVCRQEELFAHAVRTRKDWSSDEIREAWDILVNTAAPVRNWLAFIAGTIQKLRIKQKAAYAQGEKRCQKKSHHKKKDPNSSSAPILENDIEPLVLPKVNLLAKYSHKL